MPHMHRNIWFQLGLLLFICSRRDAGEADPEGNAFTRDPLDFSISLYPSCFFLGATTCAAFLCFQPSVSTFSFIVFRLVLFKTGTFLAVHFPVFDSGLFLSSKVIDAGGLGHTPWEEGRVAGGARAQTLFRHLPELDAGGKTVGQRAAIFFPSLQFGPWRGSGGLSEKVRVCAYASLQLHKRE